jgi:hypothetical protein
VLERFSPNTLSNSLPELDSHAEAEVKTELENSVTEQRQTFEEEKAEELRTDERREQPESQPDTERIIPEVQVNQFIVENLGGLLAPSDTVRIDNESLSQWKELYDNADIEEAIVETFGGKSSRCKLKPIKDAKFQGKGIIQIPEKIQEALEIRKGELVRVKPVVE